MKKLIGSCGIIACAMIAAACSGRHETTTVHRETVQTVPAAPAVVEKKTTIESGGVVERRTTETRETGD